MRVTPDQGLWNRGFVALFVTQFFEAASDNVIKVLLSFAVAEAGPWIGAYGDAAQGAVGIAFTLPFIVLSAFAGRIADRYSKSRTTLVLKALSVGVALLTVFAFGADSPLLAMIVFLLFTIVSSFFGPVKYGMVAELVGPDNVVRANGIINMGTNLAVITGMLVGGMQADLFSFKLEFGQWLPGLAMLAFACCALVAALYLPRLPAQSPTLSLDPNPFTTYMAAMRDMAKRSALGVAVAWSFFYFLAAMVLLMLPDYAQILSVSVESASILMGLMGLAIGVGCLLAAYLCGALPNPRFVTAGALGLTLAFALLGCAPRNYAVVAALLSLMGLVAGFYIIPLQAMLQVFAPDAERGRFLGTANAMSFAMGALGAGLFSLLKTLGVPSNRMFIAIAVLAAIVSVICFRWGRRLRQLILERAATLPAP